MQRKSFILILSVLLVIVIGFVLFYFFFLKPTTPSTTVTGNSPDTGFTPFGKPSTNNQQGNGGVNGNNNASSSPTEVVIPALRLLSATPIGGYGASTTASTTVVRWVDRGRGNILEAKGDSLEITTLSNTLLPRTYESIWNKNITAFIGSILSNDNETISTVYASLYPHSTSTLVTPYELRGKSLPDGIVSSAASPKKDRVFLFVVQNGRGIGYIAPLNGGSATQIFTTPITKVNVEWPEENTIAIATKGSATEGGFLYFVNPKTGVWKKIIGPLTGISSRVSHDAKYVFVSAAGKGDTVVSFVYSVTSSTGTDAVIQTLADKCVWGNFYKEMVYCGVPFQPVSGTYPDDWYKGTLSTIDKIWQVNATTGEVHLISSVFSEAKRSIDAFNLGLDEKDDFLFFMNKNDLSLWSLDLVASK